MMKFKFMKHFLMITFLLMSTLSMTSCTATEDKEFVSAFDTSYDTPIVSATQNAMEKANEEKLNASKTRLLTRDAMKQETKNHAPQIEEKTQPLMVSTNETKTKPKPQSLPIYNQPRQIRSIADDTSITSKPLSFKTPINKKKNEEPPQMDWSKIKRWNGHQRTQATHKEVKISTSTLPGPVTTNMSAVNVSMNASPVVAPASDALAAGDTLDIMVYGEEELSRSYTVDTRGIITFPLVGEIRAAGLSKKQLQDTIAWGLKTNGFLERPFVTVTLMELQPFFILGEVRTPGQYEFMPGLDVFKAIAVAGGYTPRATNKKIYITRTVNGQKTKIHADEHTDLRPGDSIFVDQRFF